MLATQVACGGHEGQSRVFGSVDFPGVIGLLPLHASPLLGPVWCVKRRRRGAERCVLLCGLPQAVGLLPLLDGPLASPGCRVGADRGRRGVCLFDFSEGLTCPLGSAVTGEKRPRWARRVMFAELVLQVVCVPLV